ncbi:transposase [Candidatus Acetothermia bacterium]|nr:transposase [Candidatus Acetothermia bacterium]
MIKVVSALALWEAKSAEKTIMTDSAYHTSANKDKSLPLSVDIYVTENEYEASWKDGDQKDTLCAKTPAALRTKLLESLKRGGINPLRPIELRPQYAPKLTKARYAELRTRGLFEFFKNWDSYRFRYFKDMGRQMVVATTSDPLKLAELEKSGVQVILPQKYAAEYLGVTPQALMKKVREGKLGNIFTGTGKDKNAAEFVERLLRQKHRVAQNVFFTKRDLDIDKAVSDVSRQTDFGIGITDKQWALLKPQLPPLRVRGRPRRIDDRRVINAILFVLHTKTPWNRLPKRYGSKATVHRRFRAWQADRTWNKLFQTFLTTLPNESEKRAWVRALCDYNAQN